MAEDYKTGPVNGALLTLKMVYDSIDNNPNQMQTPPPGFDQSLFNKQWGDLTQNQKIHSYAAALAGNPASPLYDPSGGTTESLNKLSVWNGMNYSKTKTYDMLARANQGMTPFNEKPSWMPLKIWTGYDESKIQQLAEMPLDRLNTLVTTLADPKVAANIDKFDPTKYGEGQADKAFENLLNGDSPFARFTESELSTLGIGNSGATPTTTGGTDGSGTNTGVNPATGLPRPPSTVGGGDYNTWNKEEMIDSLSIPDNYDSQMQGIIRYYIDDIDALTSTITNNGLAELDKILKENDFVKGEMDDTSSDLKGWMEGFQNALKEQSTKINDELSTKMTALIGEAFKSVGDFNSQWLTEAKAATQTAIDSGVSQLGKGSALAQGAIDAGIDKADTYTDEAGNVIAAGEGKATSALQDAGNAATAAQKAMYGESQALTGQANETIGAAAGQSLGEQQNALTAANAYQKAGLSNAYDQLNPYASAGQTALAKQQQMMAQGAPTSAAPKAEDYKESPYYQFLLKQNMQAIERSAAAKGSVLDPSTMTALQERAGDLASMDYEKWRNQQMENTQFERNQYFENLTPYQQMAASGQDASGRLADYSAQTGSQMSGNVMDYGRGAASTIQGAASQQSQNLGQLSALGQATGAGVAQGQLQTGAGLADVNMQAGSQQGQNLANMAGYSQQGGTAMAGIYGQQGQAGAGLYGDLAGLQGSALSQYGQQGYGNVTNNAQMGYGNLQNQYNNRLDFQNTYQTGMQNIAQNQYDNQASALNNWQAGSANALINQANAKMNQGAVMSTGREQGFSALQQQIMNNQAYAKDKQQTALQNKNALWGAGISGVATAAGMYFSK